VLVSSYAWIDFGGPTPDPRVATVESIVGEVLVRGDSGAGARVALKRGDGFSIGDHIETAAGSRVVLRRPGGIEVRVAGGGELTWQTADALRLARGLVYVDTEGGATGADPLEVVTHTGRIRHIGTRFSVQVDALEVRVMVRDGAVSVGGANRAQEQRVPSGYIAQIGADGQVLASAMKPGEGPWHWIAGDEPEFALEGRSLHAVLEDIAQAQGVPLRYGSREVEASARQQVLHGPALKLDAAQAVDAVLLTTQFIRRDPFEIIPRP
jgi:ferric-dicitrate binding protein FerR (iron transport regulator)